MRKRLPSPPLQSFTMVWILAWYSLPEAIAYHRSSDLMPQDLQLFQPCRSSFDCLIHIAHSHCDWAQRICTCQPYHVPFNNTMCLPSSLLGFNCILDSQCKMKVPNSRCTSHVCECEPDYLPLRRDKCLPPAVVGDYCLNNKQCHLGSSYSYCKYIIPRVYGKCKCPFGYLVTEEGKCLPYLGSECEKHQDCEEATPGSFCQRIKNTARCECRDGYEVSSNGMNCLQMPQFDAYNVQPVSLGKSCRNSIECQARDPNSECIEGICNCPDPNDSCNAHFTDCRNDTFQCRSGYCISWYFVCDKQTNCPDNSDEDECIPFNCPRQAFQCDDGTCLSRSLVCNGQWECPDGSDEARCYKGIPCDRNAFRCRNGQCLPQYTFCNAVQDCADGSDEIENICEQGKTCPRASFQCENGRCRSSAILCSGLDGCGDNSDETHCEVCYCKRRSGDL